MNNHHDDTFPLSTPIGKRCFLSNHHRTWNGMKRSAAVGVNSLIQTGLKLRGSKKAQLFMTLCRISCYTPVRICNSLLSLVPRCTHVSHSFELPGWSVSLLLAKVCLPSNRRSPEPLSQIVTALLTRRTGPSQTFPVSTLTY